MERGKGLAVQCEVSNQCPYRNKVLCLLNKSVDFWLWANIITTWKEQLHGQVKTGPE